MTANDHRQGKRVIYISVSRLVLPSGEGPRDIRQLDQAKLVPLGEVDLIQWSIEETAHLETIRLVREGRLSEKYYDRPSLNWFEKAAKTVCLHSLASLEQELIARYPERQHEAREFIGAYRSDLEASIQEINRRLRPLGETALPLEDTSYDYLQESPGAGLEGVAEQRATDFLHALFAEAQSEGLTPVVIGPGLEERHPQLKGLARLKILPMVRASRKATERGGG